MNNTNVTINRVLAIALSTNGFGFAILEGDKLCNWGVKRVSGEKNGKALIRAEGLISRYQPGVLILEDMTNVSRRSARIKSLNQKMMALAKNKSVKVISVSQDQIKKAFFAEGKGTRHELAQIIANKFPDELGFQLPAKRKTWASEDAKMDIFMAAAFALLSMGSLHYLQSKMK